VENGGIAISLPSSDCNRAPGIPGALAFEAGACFWAMAGEVITMAVVDSDLLFETTAGVKTVFNDAYIKAQQAAQWQKIATEIPTTLPIQNYAFLGRGAIMKLFLDEVEEQTVREIDYSIADSIFKAELAVSRKSLEDDQYGLVMMRARDLGNEPVRHWNKLAYKQLTLGFASLCYDGQFMFDTDHSEGSSGTQSNVTSASLSDPALEAAEKAMMAFVDDKGEPLEVTPDTLVVGPALKRQAWNLVGQPINVTHVGDGTAGSGATAATGFANYFEGRYNLVVNPYLIGAAAYEWFLLDTSRAVKPIVIQSRQDVPITFETDMTQPSAMIREKYNFTIRGRYACAFGLWELAYGSSATS
jgi:phage major head subunit gpT-like protein